MSMDTVKRITEMLRAARTDGMSDDPLVRASYFERKAETFDAIANDTENILSTEQSRAEAKGFAEDARAHARELRGVQA